MEYGLVVEDIYDGYRLDKYLSEAIPELSRSYLQRVIKENGILVNGKAVRGSYRVSQGEEIHLQVPEAVIPEIAPDMAFAISSFLSITARGAFPASTGFCARGLCIALTRIPQEC